MPAKKTRSKKPASRSSNASTGAVKVNGVSPFLWFNKGAEDAARFYVTLIKGSRIVKTNPMGCTFLLGGQRFEALNGGPHYQLTPAFSIYVSVNTQDEVDALWSKLTADGGQESMCGWLVDRFGVSWQIIPRRLEQLLFHKDRAKAQRATDAMLKMQKIIISDLESAIKTK